MSRLLRMWEARAEPGALPRLLDWLNGTVVPAARAAGAVEHRLAAADEPDPRAVLITGWDGAADWTEPAPPPGTVARAHAWVFRQVAP